MDYYRERIIDHYKDPQNWGDMNNPDVVMVGNNLLCGDILRLKLKIDNRKLKDFKFIGSGCALSIAAASLLSEMVKDMEVTKVKKLKKEDILNLLGTNLSPNRLKCGLLCLDTLLEAVKRYEGK